MSDERAVTDRGMWRVVAARDFWVRLRDKGFVISTMITLTVLSVFILLRAYSGGPESFELGYVGEPTVANDVAALADQTGLEVSVVGFDDDREAEVALREGRVDAVLEGGVDDVRGGTAILRVLRGAPDLLDQLVQGAAIGLRIDTALSEAGVDDATVQGLKDQHPIEALASHGANQALHLWILPWRPRRDRSITDAHRPHPGREDMSIGAVIVAHQVGRG